MSGLAIYQWRAVDAGGARRAGVLSARTEAEAYRQVAAMGLTPVRIGPAPAGGRRGRVSGKDLAHFTAQLGVLMDARIPVSDGLQSIAEQETNKDLRQVIRDVAGRIEAGETIAQALEAHRAVFGDVYIETIRAAEQSGTLTKAMEQLSEMLERAQETRRMIKSALMYPMCVVCVMALGMVFLVGYVVPKFAGMFASRGMQLPTLTQGLLTIGQSMQQNWYVWLIVAFGSVWGGRRLARSDWGRAAIERWSHKVPIVRDVLRGLALARFTRVFGVSLSSGVGLISSLELAGKASGRRTLNADVGVMIREIEGGKTLADGIRKSSYLTGFTQRMLAAGETGGELPRMCQVVARHYDRETAHLTKSLTTLIEPVLVVGIAGMVLVVALAIFLPMWNMVNLLG